MTIGERIKKIRKEKNIAVYKIIEKVGVSRQTYQRYETGAIKNIPSDKIEALAKALNTTPSYLMGWDEKVNEVVVEEDRDIVIAALNTKDVTKALTDEEEAFKTILNSFGYDFIKRESDYAFIADKGGTTLTKDEFNELLSSSVEYIELNTKILYKNKIQEDMKNLSKKGGE